MESYDKRKFEVRAVLEVIAGKQARKEDATFEEGLLKAWHKCSGWGKVIDACSGGSVPILRGCK